MKEKKMPEIMKQYPTPTGTPTQIYFRIVRVDGDNIFAEIGVDGEETAPTVVLAAMGIVASSAALTFRDAGQEQAANAADATADRLLQLCEQREAENG
jgi:hypothetical protein